MLMAPFMKMRRLIFGTVMLAITPSLTLAQNSPGFAGQISDQETAWTYLRTRYYDPETGTYLTKDPIGIKGGLNSYQYVGNDPVNAVDPDGLWIQAVGGAIIGGVIGLGAQAIGDLVRGNVSSWQNYAASGVGGAVFGATVALNPWAAGAAAGAAASLTRQLFGDQ